MKKLKYIQRFDRFNFISEELQTKDTYFTKQEDLRNKAENEIKIMIDELKFNDEISGNPSKEEIAAIKIKISKQCESNEIVKKYFDEYLYNPKDKNDFLWSVVNKILSVSSPVVSQKSSTKKFEIKKLDFKLIDHVDNIETYQVIFPEDIKNYIINNFSTNKLDYLIYINCESDNFNRLHFPGRMERWYRSHNKRFGKDEQPQPYKGRHGKWITDLFDGIPESLRGTGLGYAIYKEFIKFKGYVSSGSWSSTLSQSVWKKLSTDKDLFGILVNYEGQDGNIILFDRNYKGDIKKVCEDFMNSAKLGKLYRGQKSNFRVKNIEIDMDLQKIISE